MKVQRVFVLMVLIGCDVSVAAAAAIDPGQVAKDVFRPEVAVGRGGRSAADFSVKGLRHCSIEVEVATDISRLHDDESWSHHSSVVPEGGMLAGRGSAEIEGAVNSAGRAHFYRAKYVFAEDPDAPNWPLAEMEPVHVGAMSASIRWSPAQDNLGVVAYAVYVDGQYRGFVQHPGTEYLLTGLAPATSHAVDVVACDAAGNTSQHPVTLAFTTSSMPEPATGAAQTESGVLLHSGELVYAATDIETKGKGFGLEFVRTYRSQSQLEGRIGHGWTANVFEYVVEHTNGDVSWCRGDGRVARFRVLEAGGYASPICSLATISRDSAGFRIDCEAGIAREFGPEGRIASLSDGQGGSVRYTYAGDFLQTVTDGEGNGMELAYDVAGRLQSITCDDGWQFVYGYDSAGNLETLGTLKLKGKSGAQERSRYFYNTGNPDPLLSHNLVQVVAPQEISESSLTASEILSYGTSGVEYDRVTSHTIGNVNANNGSTGGDLYYSYIPGEAYPYLTMRTVVADGHGRGYAVDFLPTGEVDVLSLTQVDMSDGLLSHGGAGRGSSLLLSFASPCGQAGAQCEALRRRLHSIIEDRGCATYAGGVLLACAWASVDRGFPDEKQQGGVLFRRLRRRREHVNMPSGLIAC